jgi:centractin
MFSITALWSRLIASQGSGAVKAGFAGEDQPKCFFPSWCARGKMRLTDNSVGRTKHVRVMAGAVEGDIFMGRKAQELRGLLRIKYPMEHGVVTDWCA